MLEAGILQQVRLNPSLRFKFFFIGYYRASASCYDDDDSYVSCPGLNWDILNPSLGIYDFSFLELFLKNMVERKKGYVHIRVRNLIDTPELRIPYYLTIFNKIKTSWGASPWHQEYTMLEIEYYRCEFLYYWEQLVNKMIDVFDSSNYFMVLDIGSVGQFGEWATNKFLFERGVGQHIDTGDPPTYVISTDTHERITRMFTGGKGVGTCVDNYGKEHDVYYDYRGFSNKFIIGKGDQEFLEFQFNLGCGFRMDVLGCNHFMESDRSELELWGDRWKYAPSAAEFCGNSADAVNISNSLCFVRSSHMSLIDRTIDEPTNDIEKWNELFRNLGYRIVLEKAEYSNTVNAGEYLHMKLFFKNNGTAPRIKSILFICI